MEYKSWLILQAYAKQQGLIDLKADTKQEFGAPPIMFKAAMTGDIDGVINFWHFQAKAKAAGLKEIISVQDAAKSLGLDPSVPLLGYIVNGKITGIGRQIHTQFSIFNITGVLAYTLSFVVLILFIGFLIMQPLERYATRWRQADA